MSALLALLLAAQVESGQRVALLVGINEFTDEAWPDLRYARKDVADLKSALEERFDVIRTVDEGATLERVHEELDKLVRAADSDEDTVVVYFSTHGTLADDESGRRRRVLVLEDTSSSLPLSTGLTYADLIERLSRARARKKLIVLAACHAGVGKSRLPPPIAEELPARKALFFPRTGLVMPEGQIILAASTFEEGAHENDELENDIYTHFLVKAIRERADFDGNGATTVIEAHDYAFNATVEFTRGKQRPTLTAHLIGRDSIVLSGRRTRRGRSVIIGYARRLYDSWLEIDGRRKGALPGTYEVGKGTRQVRVVHSDTGRPIFSRAVVVRDGDQIVLDDLIRTNKERRWSFQGGGGFVFVRGQFGRSYLPSHYVLGAGLRYEARPGLFIGLWLGGTSVSREVELISGGENLVDEPTSATLVRPRFEVIQRLFGTHRGELRARAYGGWVFGKRRFKTTSVAQRDQLLSFPLAGLGFEGSIRMTDGLTLSLEAGVDAFFPEIEGVARVALGDRYGIFATFAM